MKKKCLILVILVMLGIPLMISGANALYNAKEVEYDNSKSGTKVVDVQNALDELYSMTENYCPDEYVCTKKHEITYVLDGGTNPNDAPSFYLELVTTLLPIPTKTGYVFLGWYENANFSGNVVTSIPEGTSGNKKYYAKWEDDWKLIVYNYTFPQVANAYYQSPIYDFGFRTGVTLKLTGSTGTSNVVNNALYQLEYSDDGIHFEKMPMKSGCNWYQEINKTDAEFWDDGNIENDPYVRGIRFQWTTNYRAQLSYYEKHRYWRVTCKTQNNSGTDSFTLESQVYGK